jgi:two-component system chemotaxis response regulator CheB
MMIRVLIAEDSPTVRDLLVWVLQSDPEIEVVGAARDGLEAIRLAARTRPNVIIMDLHMPNLDGFEASKRIMEETPTPIVVVSASMEPAALQSTFEALRVGALAAVEKPTGPANPNFEDTRQKLLTTVKLMADVKVVRRWRTKDPHRSHPEATQHPIAAASRPQQGQIATVALAASTGGPGAVHQVLSRLPTDLPVPILVVQHINPGFGQGLAEWLDRTTDLTVRTARQGETPIPGCVLVAPDDRHMLIRPGGQILLSPRTPGNGICPSADRLFASMAKSFGRRSLGVIMTGMGRDGVEGLRLLKAAGGMTVAQDETSCVVFGMPKEAIAAGIVDHVVPLERIAATIVDLI